MTRAEILKWIDQKVQRTANTEIIELIYFAKYQEKAGFKFALDGFHHVIDQQHPHVAIYYLNPPHIPASHKHKVFNEMTLEEQNAALGIQLNSNYQWDSPLESPIFNEGFFTFKDIPFDKSMTIVIDVKKIIFSGRRDKHKVENVGWTIVPVFTPNGYVKSGIKQFPLFKGDV